jgi:signal transduction histidine kinase
MPARPRWSLRLIFVFAAVVASFVAATAFEHSRLAAIDHASHDIAENASPSIERLTAARGELRRIQVQLRDYVDRGAAAQPAERAAIEHSRRELDRAISEYLAMEPFPEEQTFWAGILSAQSELHEGVTRSLAEADHGNHAAAAAIVRSTVSGAGERLSVAIARDIDFNASRAHDLALEIARVRGQSTYVAFGLDALCALIALGGAIALHRAIREHAELAENHHQLSLHRASELEQFAGSVAHDILSPLNAVGLSLELAGRSGDDPARAGWVRRGTSSLARVERLVNGLLEFARAGASPGTDARCNVASTIGDLAPDLEVAAVEAGADLEVQIRTKAGVSCNAGVLTSMVANLARNAIKYIGDGPLRRIEVRATELKGRVRVEVQDSGPGLPEGLEAHVFEPYVRGPHATQSGIGLGLATVKRLVEAHDGKVGVVSVAGRGCTFWFELPARGEPAAESSGSSANLADASSSVRHAH